MIQLVNFRLDLWNHVGGFFRAPHDDNRSYNVVLPVTAQDAQSGYANILLAGLAQQLHDAPSGADVTPLEDALRRITSAVEGSAVRHAELWSYRIESGRLVPTRYGASSDVQLWSLTDLAVQYLLNARGP